MLECKSISPYTATPSSLTHLSPNPSNLNTENSPSQLSQSVERALSALSACSFCKIEKTDLLQCSRCKRVKYCNRICQKAAWKIHKFACENSALIPEDDKIVCSFQDNNGSVFGISQKQFKEKINSTLVLHPLYSETTRKLAVEYSEKQTLGKGPEAFDKIALFHQGELMHHGIIALQDIPRATKICRFGGRVITKNDWVEKNPLEYSHRAKVCSTAGAEFVFDPSDFASLGAIVNDGPPNCEIMTDFTLKSYPNNLHIPLEKLLITVNDIKKGEILYIDYGAGHPVKRGIYQLDKNSLDQLFKKFPSYLDMSALCSTGWLSKATTDGEKYNPFFAISTKLQYILSTPYVLAKLHLETSLNPLKTHEDFKKIAPKILDQLSLDSCENPDKIKEAFEHNEDILVFLSKVQAGDKLAFSDLIGRVSQHSFIHLCSALKETTCLPTVKACEQFCRAFDKMKSLFVGTLAGCYWDCSEKVEFEKLFFSEDHQKKLYDVTDIKSLPEILQKEYDLLHTLFFITVLRKLPLEKQMLLERNKFKYQLSLNVPVHGVGQLL